MRLSKQKQQGFTLIELVVVIVILGILAAFAVPRFIDINTDARKAAVEGLAGSMRSASALLHGLSMARGNPATLTLEGTVITMSNGYPAGTHATGIGQTMTTLAGFNNDAPTATSVRYWPVSLGATAVATCQVTYTGAAAGGAPTILMDVTTAPGCS